MRKVAGEVNPTDLLTKGLAQELLQRHLRASNVQIRDHEEELEGNKAGPVGTVEIKEGSLPRAHGPIQKILNITHRHLKVTSAAPLVPDRRRIGVIGLVGVLSFRSCASGPA